MFATIIICFIKSVQRTHVDAGAFFGPEAGCAFLLVAALHCFRLDNGTFSSYWFHNS